MSINQSSPLLNIPQELLDEIISYVVAAHLPPPTPHSGGCAWKLVRPLNIMTVCRRLRAGAGKMLFNRNFEFWSNECRPLRWWIQCVPLEHRQHIRSMQSIWLVMITIDQARRRAAAEDRKYGLREGTCWVAVSSAPRPRDPWLMKWVNGKGEVDKKTDQYTGEALHI